MPRSMLTQGSTLPIIARLVTTCWRCGTSVPPTGLEHPRPEPAGRAELGDRGELLVGRGVAELDQAGGLVDGEAGLGEQAEVVHADGHRPAELLGVARTRVVQRGAVDDRAEHAEGLRAADGRDEGLRNRRLPVGRPARRTGARSPGRRRGCCRGAGRPASPRAAGPAPPTLRAGSLQGDRGQVEQHARAGPTARSTDAREVEVQRRGAVVEVDQGRLVDRGGVRRRRATSARPRRPARAGGPRW